VRGIRELDGNGSIGMFSMEVDPPYIRPNLSKGLWKDKPVDKIWRHTLDLGVDLFLDLKINHLDPGEKTIRDQHGEDYGYEKLLLATGGSPAHLPFGGDDVIYFRNFQDYRHLRALSEGGEDFLVIGGGFIGSEIAAALTIVGSRVVMVFPKEAICGNIFPGDLALYLNDYFRRNGVEVVAGETVEGIERNGSGMIVRTANKLAFEVGGVVAGIGIRPNVDLAVQAGLKVDNGIVVDRHLQTTAPDVFAAGDVANFYHSAHRKHERVEHEDNAVQMGKLAGRNMAGANEAYSHVPMFYSDLFELGYEAVGELNSELEIVADWKEEFKKGVIYYLQEERVRGVLLWNVWDTVPAARALLAEPGPFRAEDLKGRLG
jgi:NADPH-dependent 2,4-dienoyl-CoA reductase/sulfur reductase-like enzyme